MFMMYRLNSWWQRRKHKRDHNRELKEARRLAAWYKHNYDTLLAEVKRSPSRVVEVYYNERHPT